MIFRVLTRGEIIRKAKELNVDPSEAVKARSRYLCNEIIRLLEVAIEGNAVTRAIVDAQLEEYLVGLKALKPVKESMHDIDSLDRVTDWMITIARTVPVETLIDFSRGKTTAWCHDDNNPSLFHGTRTNKAICPVCDKKFGPIDILMTRDGYSFTDAVRRLQT